MDQDTCTLQPSNRAAYTLRATLSHRDKQGVTQVILLFRVYSYEQNVCITLSEASGTFQSLDSNKHLVQSVDGSIRAESLGEPIPLTVHLQQSQEPCQMQSCNIKTVLAAQRVGHHHAHQKMSADPKPDWRVEQQELLQ